MVSINSNNRYSVLLDIEEPSMPIKAKHEKKKHRVKKASASLPIKEKLETASSSDDSNSLISSTALKILSHAFIFLGSIASGVMYAKAQPTTNGTFGSASLSPQDPYEIKDLPKLLEPFNIGAFTHPGSYFTSTNYRTVQDMEQSLGNTMSISKTSYSDVASNYTLKMQILKVSGRVCDIDDNGYGRDLFSYPIERTHLDDAIKELDKTYGHRELTSFQPQELTKILGEINGKIIPPVVKHHRSRGVFKKGDVVDYDDGRYGFEPDIDKKEITDCFKETLRMVASKRDPIEIAAYVHLSIGRLQPFVIGNGRTAYVFMNWILTKLGHDPITFPKKREYLRAVDFSINDKENKSFVQYLKKRSKEGIKRDLETDCKVKLGRCAKDMRNCNLNLDL